MYEKIEKVEYKVYEKYIDIELFNEALSFLVDTASKNDKNNVLSEIRKKCIWIGNADYSKFIEKYQFQYFGELLERYEERIGKNIETVRAIALVLGYGKNLIEPNMIIGTQLVDFINKIKSLAENDIYIQAALYLYDNTKYSDYSKHFKNEEAKSTEEIVFALSVFYERREEFFRQNRQQLVKLLGENRTISGIGNIGIFAWLIKTLYPLISKDRKKDIMLLKALIKLPTGFQKEDTNIYKELINNRYSKEEIAYLNYLLLYYEIVPKSVRLGNSIVEEKIVINLCKIFINSEKEHESSVYTLIKAIFKKYDNFDIKLQGYSTIKTAIMLDICVTNPITFAELYYELGETLFSFDILDKKWDIVAIRADNKKYQDIFDNFLLYGKYDKGKIKECIEKYDKLTNSKYIESFLNYNIYRKNVFNFLVDSRVLILKSFFYNIVEKENLKQCNYLKEYIQGVYNKQSFEFLKYLLRLNKYSISEISNIGFRFEKLFNNCGWNKSINIERKFLNIKEKKLLFDCVEKLIFYNIPKQYFEFLEATLKTDMISNFLKKEELRQIYLSLCEIDPEEYKKEELQEKYLTPEEMNVIREKKRIENELKERTELLEAEKFAMEKFEEITDKNSFEKLLEYCKNYKNYSKEIKFCIRETKKYMLKHMYMFSKEKQETMYFIQILEFFMDKGELTYTEFTEITYEYIKGEVQGNECISTAC